VRPSESVDAIFQVNGASRPAVSVALHSEPESTNVTLIDLIRDPNGRIVNTNEFSKDFYIQAQYDWRIQSLNFKFGF
jgi:hypothetical protein